MPPKRKSSVIWKVFSKNEAKNTVQCKLCKNTFKDFGNTTNMLKLKKVHPLRYSTLNEEGIEGNSSATSASESEVSEKSDVYMQDEHDANVSTQAVASKNTTAANNAQSQSDTVPPSRKRQLQMKFLSKGIMQKNSKAIDRALVEMICLDFQPLQIIENTGFQNYTYKLNPHYVLPLRKTLSEKLLTEHYSLARAATLEKLQKVQYLSVTTDIWSSDSNKSFLTLTVHFIYKTKLIALTLSTAEMSSNHTAEHIAMTIRDILENQRKIYDKVITIVTDNAANVKKAVSEYLNKRNHFCVAHTLNLAVQDCLKENEHLSKLVEKCRTIVSHFKRSNQTAYKLREIQQQINLEPLKLKQDVQTR
ncbi:PREDICTED: zinc finger BED domain-containing protein 1-like [Cyphomyrmex costatus]|uniref:zinc finger BED domain-containing protein 1-like n=1 Tax=Cyphomyrmex costatus TaxID=456900 RepID=UPI0008522FDB|nr:PREDICTED: zinc finger BED domain-containing protein 1-like [Cyphomyrmex costatus]